MRTQEQVEVEDEMKVVIKNVGIQGRVGVDLEQQNVEGVKKG